VLAVDVQLAGDAVDKPTARETTTRAVCMLGSGLCEAERRRVGACVCVVRLCVDLRLTSRHINLASRRTILLMTRPTVPIMVGLGVSWRWHPSPWSPNLTVLLRPPVWTV
jgi:hypothetical protein